MWILLSETAFAIFVTQFTFQMGFVSGDCFDIHGGPVPLGIHYIPGPDKCLLCVCGDDASAKWCKKVLCSPPDKCKSFIMGSSCCDFVCTDSTLVNETRDEMDRKFIIFVMTAFLILTLIFFIVNKLRRHLNPEHPSRQISNDRNHNGSIGFIAGSIGYLNLPNGRQYDEHPMVHFPLYKPPGSYFHHVEAPPPYDEAVADTSLNASTLTTSLSSESRANAQPQTNNTSYTVACMPECAIDHENNIRQSVNVTSNWHSTIPLPLRESNCTNLSCSIAHGVSQEEIEMSEGYRTSRINAMTKPVRMDAAHNTSYQQVSSCLDSTPPRSTELNSQPNSLLCSRFQPLHHSSTNNTLSVSHLERRTVSASLSSPLPSSSLESSDPREMRSLPYLPKASRKNSKKDNQQVLDSVGKLPFQIACLRLASTEKELEEQKSSTRNTRPYRRDFSNQLPFLRSKIEMISRSAKQKHTSQPNTITTAATTTTSTDGTLRDYHAECENCNITATTDNADSSFEEQETMTLQRNLHDSSGNKNEEQQLNISQTLPLNTRTKREFVSRRKIGTAPYSGQTKSLYDVSSADEEEDQEKNSKTKDKEKFPEER